MGTLIRTKLASGTRRLYRYGSPALLLRTPITISLNPDTMWVFGFTVQRDSLGYPAQGYVLNATGDYSTGYKVGHDCLNAVDRPTHVMNWQQVTNALHKPEFVWYQGQYATSANTMAMSMNQCECYAQWPAYHFTIPQTLQGLTATKVVVSFTNGGAVICEGSPINQSTGNKALKGYGTEFNSWKIPIAVTSDLKIGNNWFLSQPYDKIVDIFADTGTYRGWHDLWGFAGGGSSRDGGIPTILPEASLPVKTYQLGTSTLAKFNSTHGGYFVPFMEYQNIGSSNNYRPLFAPERTTPRGQWACMSIWDIKLKVTLE